MNRPADLYFIPMPNGWKIEVGKDRVTDPARISEAHRRRMLEQSGASIRAETDRAERKSPV